MNTVEVLAEIPFPLDFESVRQRARVKPGSEDALALAQLAARAAAAARPKALYRESFVEERGEDWVRIDGVRFTSRALRWHLQEVGRVFPYVATCGGELDTLELDPEDILQPYWLEVIKTFALDAARQHLEAHLQARYLLGKSAAMAPGSADEHVWPIEQQRELFALLEGVSAHIGVTLSASCLMLPNKSVSGIRFPTAADFRSCQVCRRQNCPGRRAPFDADLWQHTRPVRGG